MNSDLTVVFLEILPRLASGVLVHLHDIYLPFDYDSHYQDRFWNEQYILGTYLSRACSNGADSVPSRVHR